MDTAELRAHFLVERLFVSGALTLQPVDLDRVILGGVVPTGQRELSTGGEYQWRREGEFHLFNPETVFKLQHATRAKRYDIFKEYTRKVDDQAGHLATLRALFQFQPLTVELAAQAAVVAVVTLALLEMLKALRNALRPVLRSSH